VDEGEHRVLVEATPTQIGVFRQSHLKAILLRLIHVDAGMAEPMEVLPSWPGAHGTRARRN
jgi:hypothetical protein